MEILKAHWPGIENFISVKEGSDIEKGNVLKPHADGEETLNPIHDKKTSPIMAEATSPENDI